MTDDTCSVDGCDKARRTRSLCGMHHMRMLRTGQLELRSRRLCSIDGCDHVHEAHGYCKMHYNRLLDHGSVDWVSPWRARGTGSISNRGYVRIHRPGHPVAYSSGAAMEHRVVLYDTIGPGSHPCHWCGVMLEWSPELTVDHLDWNRANNVPENLVPSCASCNSDRKQVDQVGADHPKARLTEADVRAIRAATEPHSAIAKRFGVSKSAVSHIKTYRNWKHVA